MPEIIQKATEYAKQSSAFKKRRPFDTLHQTHLLQPKYDGCHLLIDTTARRAFSRTNETVRSCDHLVDMVHARVGKGFIVQGEAYHPELPFPQISGLYRQHAPAPVLEFYAYDILFVREFEAGRCISPYHERFDELEHRLPDHAAHTMLAHGIDLQAEANKYVAAGGHDGLILRDPHAQWVAGLAREGELIKVKPHVSLDLPVVGVITVKGEKTGRDVFKLVVDYRGDHVVGSGVPHKPEELPAVGQIVEIECMCVNPNGTLREPRFKGIRYDKLEPDK